MQSHAPTDSATPASFAGFLAALTQSNRAEADHALTGAPSQSPIWNDELLADDVATLSYERALRAHSRYRADVPAVDPPKASPPPPDVAAAPQPEAAFSVQTIPEKVLKDASITIRLNRDENAQLRKRAAEAGLTVSAYIRSCTFEAETLRALVKDTLVQFRTASAPPLPSANPSNRRHWSALFWPGRRANRDSGPNQA
jgi:hypothetical protein